MIRRTERNRNYEPLIESEGVYRKPLPIPPGLREGKWWYEGLKPSDRMFYHQTLSSARRYAHFKQKSIIPTCSIDNTLLSQFDQSNSIFANKREVCQTPETMGKETFRRLRNYTTTTEEKVGHPLKIGGLKKKISPHSLKMMNTGPHATITNPGYARQPDGGFIFNY